MFERPKSGERAILVNVEFGSAPDPDECEELRELALSAGATVLASVNVSRNAADPRYLIGSGKVEELAERVATGEAELVIVGRDLSPSQERNLERRLQCRVLDRTGLILDIFAQRARSFEGKLQVELAQLRHLSTRLVRGWTHLERQKGGIGLRGPGETQLETDRRLVGQRIRRIRERLEKVDSRRELGRRNRLRSETPTVSLVGYTNAGKSTLFNALTEARVYAADQLFATLDPTLRRVELSEGTGVVLADTVGFVRDLPHELVAAFRSTLKETRDASLILHVIDASDPQRLARVHQVNKVLDQIGAGQVPQLRVYNKIDVLARRADMDVDDDGNPRGVWLSARTGEGLDLLLEALGLRFRTAHVRGCLELSAAEARQRSVLYEAGAICSEESTESGGWRIELDMDATDFARFCAHENIAEDRLEIPAAEDEGMERRAAS